MLYRLFDNEPDLVFKVIDIKDLIIIKFIR